jgi:hypothetical protein
MDGALELSRVRARGREDGLLVSSARCLSA